MKKYILSVTMSWLAIAAPLSVQAAPTPDSTKLEWTFERSIPEIPDTLNNTVVMTVEDDDEYDDIDDAVHSNLGLVRILAILIPFASLVGIVWLTLYYRTRRHRAYMHMLETAIQHQCELPPGFDTLKGRSPISVLRSGIVWVGVGLAVILMFVFSAWTLMPVGLIPLFVGLARIATYFTVTRAEKSKTVFPPQPPQ